MEKIALIFDCGATNVRVIAINAKGEIKASKALPNNTQTDPHFAGGRIWDVNEIWQKLCDASKQVIACIDPESVVAVTTTTFGVDGTFIDKQGKLLYPVISWQCERTVPIMQNISKYIPLEELFRINGVNAYSFNTINKLIWFNENHPEIASQAECFLFMPSLINHLLCNAKYNDWSMLGTSMLTDIATQTVSDEILKKIGFNPNIFGQIGQAGQAIGCVSASASVATGIPKDVMVCLSGHDTQFAIFGSGAAVNQPVLSSGTWEILMSRNTHCSTSPLQLADGITTEFDAERGLYNIGVNWLGSGIVEWIRNNFYPDCSPETCYDVMISEAEKVLPGSNGLILNPDFAGLKNPESKGILQGLTLNTTRGEIVRAAFEALAFQTRYALEVLERAGNFKAETLICVGGGSKNRLWNQLRADCTGIPITTIDQKETTALGAAFFAFQAAGVCRTAEQMRQSINYNQDTIHPSKDSNFYTKLYQQWKKEINR